MSERHLKKGERFFIEFFTNISVKLSENEKKKKLGGGGICVCTDSVVQPFILTESKLKGLFS